MSYCLFESPTRVAKRKVHKCIWCGQKIPLGDKYVDERSVYDGNIQRHRWHPECRGAMQSDMRDSGDDEFSPYDNERPTPPAVSGERGQA